MIILLSPLQPLKADSFSMSCLIQFDPRLSPLENEGVTRSLASLPEISFLVVSLQRGARGGHARLCPLTRVGNNGIKIGNLMSGMINIQSVRNYFLTPAAHALLFAAATSLNERVSFQQGKVNISIWAFEHLQDGSEALVFY